MEVLVIFHSAGKEPKRDYPLELGDAESYFTTKCIPTNENAEEFFTTFHTIPNTLDVFLWYDGTDNITMYSREGKGYVQMPIMYLGVTLARLLISTTSFKELAMQDDTYGDDSSDEEV